MPEHPSGPLGADGRLGLRRALCPELDVASQGPTVEEATSNLREAVELFRECADPQEVKRRRHPLRLVRRAERPAGARQRPAVPPRPEPGWSDRLRRPGRDGRGRGERGLASLLQLGFVPAPGEAPEPSDGSPGLRVRGQLISPPRGLSRRLVHNGIQSYCVAHVGDMNIFTDMIGRCAPASPGCASARPIATRVGPRRARRVAGDRVAARRIGPDPLLAVDAARDHCPPRPRPPGPAPLAGGARLPGAQGRTGPGSLRRGCILSWRLPLGRHPYRLQDMIDLVRDQGAVGMASRRAGTLLCHGVPTHGSRSSLAVNSFGPTPVRTRCFPSR